MGWHKLFSRFVLTCLRREHQGVEGVPLAVCLEQR
jgi:hypothetical protein